MNAPGRTALAAALALWLGLLAGCGGGRDAETVPPPGAGTAASDGPATKPAAGELKNEIPPAVFNEVLLAHQQGLGHMERLQASEYEKAVAAFRKVHQLAPGWIPGSINLAIALLNSSGSQEEAKKEGAGAGQSASGTAHFDEALALLDDVLRRDPGNLHAHFCRGLILEYLGRIADAHKDFRVVTERDPADAHAWYKLGSTLTAPENPEQPAGPPQAKQLIEIYTKALECNPYLVPVLYKLQQAYAWDRQTDRQRELLDLWRRLNPKQNAAAPGDAGETSYGEMGKYATVIDWSPAPKAAGEAVRPPRFESPARLGVALPEGHRWAKASDFTGPLAPVGRARARFGAPVIAFDADGDGRTDLFLASAVAGPEGVRDVLLLNRGDGRFEDASAAWKLPARASLGGAAGDYDADGRTDLFLTGIGDNRLLHNTGDAFEDVTETAQLAGPPAVSLTARWLDLDQDGDLDLYVVNYAPADAAETVFTEQHAAPGVPNVAYRNDGKPEPIAGRPQDNWAPLAVAPKDLGAKSGLSLAFTPWPEPDGAALADGAHPHTGVAWLDLDGDRDLDLVLTADGRAPQAALNDRLGRFHAQELADLANPQPINGLLVTDLDHDARPDLAVIPARGRVALWRSRPPAEGETPRVAFEFWATDAHDWLAAEAVDLDLDGAADLLGLPAAEPAPAWARNVGNNHRAAAIALGPDSASPLRAVLTADLAGDALPDLLLVRDGDGPALAQNLGNGHHYLALALSGQWKAGFDRARTNPHGLGTRVVAQGPTLNASYDHTTTSSNLGQSIRPAVIGLGGVASPTLVRLAWPDGVLQCELNATADQLWTLTEVNRKTGSCPVLFTWDGTRFVCIGDFLGGGGLGYLVAPGEYGQPDRDEAVAIAPDQLAPVDGVYRLSITEPMDEVAYLDHLTLEVIDRPPGVDAAPDERFAPGGNRPTGELLAWKSTIEPVRAYDLKGADLTETLRHWDRRTAGGFRRLGQFIGYAEEHGIVLDFADRLAPFGPDDRLVLVLAGWVEYPYSQTNYAAATAGIPLQPPVLERRRDDGTWEVIEPDPGYPAGLPRRMTLELTGKLAGPRCVLRLRTNMECYYDQAFVAVLERDPGLRAARLPVARAVLGPRGYTREVSPDGRDPLIYDYAHVDPAPLARMTGRLTRFGDVAPLLSADDDRLCLVGPGDEVRLEFDAGSLPPLPEGWTRSYVLRAVGYCKDADPFTAASDTVEPLPWKGMPAYPFGPAGERPRDPAYQSYLDEYQTRIIGP